ncbi:MAG: universal stress protein, partial [Gemmatimonadetes bacterium]|nr:universal stress protein [Gemmatimonadota bacterium]NIQ58915.1 universal stress protein [Gemmatimonadota bacterium]NIU79100.1 universal stress protein [Gammaproteobacteria bacterium]NIX47815.1 universal stress protein [Gemmatimonadota bacterium]NIY12175.1 universal stress protein [Gemmatimonadota bacterium]
VDGGFQRLAERLARTGASIETHTRAGPPPAALMDVADELEADLLAIGSDGYICNGRVVVGRV